MKLDILEQKNNRDSNSGIFFFFVCCDYYIGPWVVLLFVYLCDLLPSVRYVGLCSGILLSVWALWWYCRQSDMLDFAVVLPSV